ncbi:hypothetical protein [Microbacterium album]|uniref:Lipoprotein n=1 Tax=Microbacterium album TaxID=2053191 RepID=A0A917IC27_9MICO|nr:hypothetical protein [Microbacterium album]GGH33661.1 hypothetical protein GCM10010921_00770 [Microbacterium album]
MRAVISALALGAALLASLTACTASPQVATATVGPDGFEAVLEGVSVTGGPGVAPEGTLVTLEKSDAALESGVDIPLNALAQGVKVRLGDGLQPEEPITLTFDIDETAISEEEWSTDSTLVMLSRSEGGAVDLVETVREGNTVTATAEHLSWFWPAQVDIGHLLEEVAAFVAHALDADLPPPPCFERTATAPSGLEYLMLAAGPIWPCISADGQEITVDLYAATSSPYRAKSSPAVVGETLPGTDGDGVLHALASEYVPTAEGGVVFGGGTAARFTFDVHEPPELFEAQQDLGMLIGSVLLTLLDIIVDDSVTLDGAGKYDCLAGTVETGADMSSADGQNAERVFTTVLDCFATLPGLDHGAKLVLGLLGAVPALFTELVVGMATELDSEQAVKLAVSSRLPSWPISFDGIGPIIVDETTWEEAASWGPFTGEVFEAPGLGVCAAGGWYDTGTIYDGVTLVAENAGERPDTVDVVSVGTSAHTGIAAEVRATTAEGIGLGATEESVQAAYPDAQTRPAFDEPEVATEYILDDGDDRAIVIYVRDGVVTRVSVGNLPAVEWTDGCG